ncbi:MAG TPA: hypothetical protein VNH22_08340 [Blastocatellia bacterium]|jgi:hypothetical protein|nr:hypothetical protein [Blastocatellia bacterium]
MYPTKRGIITALILALSLAPVALAGQAPASPANTDEFVTLSGFKGKVFEVKNREGRALVKALSPLGSGFKGATITYSDEFKTLTVRDFPENLAAIEGALSRLDTPQAPRSDMELRMYILVASNIEGAKNPYPTDLNDVVKQLQTTLSYKNYYLLTSSVQRVKEGSFQLQGEGVTEFTSPLVEKPALTYYSFAGNSISLSTSPAGASVFQINDFNFNLRSNDERANIRTGLTLRDGEKVVVGTSTLRDKGIIVVLIAKMVK